MRNNINKTNVPQMCCEQSECYLAVFDHAEAVCYLKGESAVMDPDAYQKQDGFSSYTMLDRTGAAAPFLHWVISARIFGPPANV